MRQNGLAWSVSSEKGTVRQTNQDSYFAAEQMVGAKKCAAFCVADGMGGTEHGELASRMAAVMLEGWFYKEFPDLLEEKADPSFMRRCLHELLKRINVEIITQDKREYQQEQQSVSFCSQNFIISLRIVETAESIFWKIMRFYRLRKTIRCVL